MNPPVSVFLPKNCGGEPNNDGHLTVLATLFMTSRESAGVTLPLEFRIDFSSVLRVKCNITVISLLFGKYTRTFVPRLPGIPEMLYFPPPSASGNITSRGFPGTSGQTFWYISLKAMKYLYNNANQSHFPIFYRFYLTAFKLGRGKIVRNSVFCVTHICTLYCT